MNKLKVLIIGSGGREHAVGWKVKQSPKAGELFFAPGNGGTVELGTNVDIKATDIPALIDFVKREKIDLTLALPDDPLALGIVDEFRREGLKIWGPTKAAARLESSKAHAKDFMQRHNLPTAKFKTFTDFNEAKNYVENHPLPIVVKASGLALGKGVVICETKDEAIFALENALVKKVFGEAGATVVVEEFLTGPEISAHAFSDGVSYSLFPPAQDHKRVGENDTGPNTGGMGTVAPVPFVSRDLIKKIEDEVVASALSGMKKDGNIFEGILFPGLMLTADGPKILEFNARFGDPETQSYMRLLETDLIDIIEACLEKKLSQIEIKWKKGFACNIVLASAGYPGEYEKGKKISGIKEAGENPNVVVFHAGTKIDNNNLVTNGGRVLGVSAVGNTLEEALATAYEAVDKVHFEGKQYRRDIGKKALRL